MGEPGFPSFSWAWWAADAVLFVPRLVKIAWLVVW